MTSFSELLRIPRGITAVIGSGGKTSLVHRLAQELSATHASVIVATSTHIFPPADMPFYETLTSPVPLAVVGTPYENGKLTAPRQDFSELAALADYVLVEADGARRLPLKAHAPHEPVIPPQTAAVITVVGALGLDRPIDEVVHRPARFAALSGETQTATPEAVAAALIAEGLSERVLINQADSPERLAAARRLKALLPYPTLIAALKKGEILCSY